MAQTQILAAGKTQADSLEVTVGDSPAQLTMFSDEEDGKFGRVKMAILIEIGDGQFVPYVEGTAERRNYSGTYLYNTQRSYTLQSPGVYIVRRSPTDKSVGVVADQAEAPV